MLYLTLGTVSCVRLKPSRMVGTDGGGQTPIFSCGWRGRRVDHHPVAEWQCGGMGASRGLRAVAANRR